MPKTPYLLALCLFAASGLALAAEGTAAGNLSEKVHSSAASGAGAGALSFAEVCARSTTVNCWSFESETDLYYTWPQGTSCANDPFLLNHPNGRNDYGLDRQGSRGDTTANVSNAAGICTYPKRDNAHAVTGSYSLKFTMRSQSGEKTSGDWNPVFKRIGSPPNSTFARFGPGGEFWVRWAQRDSASLLTTVLQSSGGGFGGVKRMLVHGYSSSETLEETVNDGWQRRLPQLYSNSGSEYYGVQDHIGCFAQSNCEGQNPNNRAGCYSEPPCRKYRADEWRVYQVHIRVADNAAQSNGLVELYLDDEPTPVIRVTDADMSGASGPAYTETAVWTSGNGYGKLTATLFSTNKNPSQVHPEAYMWIDDVVISRERVPPLGPTTPPTTPPPAPSGVQVD